MVRGATVTVGLIAALAWTGQAGAAEVLGPFYRPADGWVGEAIVRDISRPATPACLLESDLDAFQYAINAGDTGRAQSMTDVCVMLPNESWGEIIGASAGGDYLRLRMGYVHTIRDLDGIEVFVPVMALRDMSHPDQGLRSTYNRLVGRE